MTIEWLKSISQAVARSCLSTFMVLICRHIPMVNTKPKIPNPMNVPTSNPSDTSLRNGICGAAARDETTVQSYPGGGLEMRILLTLSLFYKGH